MAGFRAGYNLYPSPIFQTYLVQKHSETAPDTPKKEGTESSFPVKVHLIPGKTPAIYKIFVVQTWCKKEKEKCKCLKIKHLHFVGYPEPGSNRHGLLHWCLRPARLPIPPSGLVCAFRRLCGGELGFAWTGMVGAKRLPDQG